MTDNAYHVSPRSSRSICIHKSDITFNILTDYSQYQRRYCNTNNEAMEVIRVLIIWFRP
jgi:hypothetical protein